MREQGEKFNLLTQAAEEILTQPPLPLLADTNPHIGQKVIASARNAVQVAYVAELSHVNSFTAALSNPSPATNLCNVFWYFHFWGQSNLGPIQYILAFRTHALFAGDDRIGNILLLLPILCTGAMAALNGIYASHMRFLDYPLPVRAHRFGQGWRLIRAGSFCNPFGSICCSSGSISTLYIHHYDYCIISTKADCHCHNSAPHRILSSVTCHTRMCRSARVVAFSSIFLRLRRYLDTKPHVNSLANLC